MNLLPRDYSRSFRVSFVATCFFMARASCVSRVGGFDEHYYFYNEDLDWSMRARRLGTRFMFLPEAQVIHYLSRGSSQNRSRITRELYRSNLYFYRKFFGRTGAFLGFGILTLEITFKSWELRKSLRRSRSDQERQRLAGTLADLEEARRLMVEEYRRSC